jgi:hypothetical protein
MREKPFTVNDLIVALRRLATMHKYTELETLIKTIEKDLSPEARRLILYESPCDTFPWLCDAGCQSEMDRLKTQD